MTKSLAYDKQCSSSFGDPEHIKHNRMYIMQMIGFLVKAGNYSHRMTDNQYKGGSEGTQAYKEELEKQRCKHRWQTTPEMQSTFTADTY